MMEQTSGINNNHIALFMSSLTGGGVQNIMRTLAMALANTGIRVDLIVCHDNTESPQILLPPNVRLVKLPPSPHGWGRLHALRADLNAISLLIRPVLLPIKSSAKLRYLAALTDYLRNERPEALLSATTNCNLVALWARKLAATTTRVVVTEHNVLSHFVRSFRRKWRWQYLPSLARHVYAEADAIICVSDEASEDLATTTGLPRNEIITVYNPVVDHRLFKQVEEPFHHAWFGEDEVPVVLSVTRLMGPQKDPATLLQAFALVRKCRKVRLIVLGDGPERDNLERLALHLGIAEDMALLGWVDNPYPYMARANVMVLSSLWEGLPTVLIEALACGCSIVATDCPGGSAGILGYGKYGRLVPISDAPAMADAIIATLDETPDQARLKARANEFSVERATRRYTEILFG